MHILFSLLCRKAYSVNRAEFTLRFGAYPRCLGFAPHNHRLQLSYFDMNSDGWQKGFTNVPPVLRAIQPIAMSKMFFSPRHAYSVCLTYQLRQTVFAI